MIESSDSTNSSQSGEMLCGALEFYDDYKVVWSGRDWLSRLKCKSSKHQTLQRTQEWPNIQLEKDGFLFIYLWPPRWWKPSRCCGSTCWSWRRWATCVRTSAAATSPASRPRWTVRLCWVESQEARTPPCKARSRASHPPKLRYWL